jgi:hypothetical protein
MAFRREILSRYLFDESFRYGCDEDDLAWRLQSDGHRIRFAPEAITYHDHRLTARQYWWNGYRQGQGSARFWYKQGIYIGRDILPATLAVATLPLVLVPELAVVPTFCAGVQLAALVYNQCALKGKSVGAAIAVLPVDLVFYAFKLAGVGHTLFRILRGGERQVRESKRRWWSGRLPLA